jgi:hypothetical protein
MACGPAFFLRWQTELDKALLQGSEVSIGLTPETALEHTGMLALLEVMVLCSPGSEVSGSLLFRGQ